MRHVKTTISTDVRACPVFADNVGIVHEARSFLADNDLPKKMHAACGRWYIAFVIRRSDVPTSCIACVARTR